MIAEARKKTKLYDNIFLAVQDMSAIGFNEKFNSVTCLFDSLNYITSESKLQQLFHEVARVLDSEGFFLFDFNSESQYETMRDGRYTLRSDKNNFILRQSFAPQLKLATSLFQFNDGNIEVHKQRAYSLSQIQTVLKKSGLRLIDSFSSSDDGRFSVQDHRIICLAELI
jgi:predicted TPR repeat methyltransferase